MTVFSGLTTFEVDFHNVDDDGRIFLLLEDIVEHGSSFVRARPGMQVQLWDEESGYCLASVVRVRRDRIEVVVQWSTWSPTPMIELQEQVQSSAYYLAGRVFGSPDATMPNYLEWQLLGSGS